MATFEELYNSLPEDSNKRGELFEKEVSDVGQLKLPRGFGCLPPCRVVLEGVQVDLTRVGNSPLL